MLVALKIASELGFSIAIPLVAFALGGRWIDHHYGTSPWGLLGGVLISIIITSVMLVQKFAKMVKDIETSSLPPNTPPTK
jgi:F0F1-type ATP synthase assembly protein I